VDQADLLPPDQVDQPRGVAQHHQRILGLGRHLGQATAIGFQARGHASALGRDQGLAALRHHRVGDINRRLFGAACFQFGRHLQQGEIGG
jgi:hypothetical protein